MEKIKAIWAKLNPKTTLIGGVLVITTAVGTCTLAPPSEEVVEEATEETTEIEEVVTLDEVEVEVIEESEEAEETE